MPQSSHRIIGVIRIEEPAPMRIDLSPPREDDTLDALISTLAAGRRGCGPQFDRWPRSRLFRSAPRKVVAANVGRLQDELEREYLELACR